MKVIIDDQLYAPVFAIETEDKYLKALEVRFDSDAGDNLTVRDYLYKLLETLWAEGEGFSGKRPFGNSCWEYDLYGPLAKEGFIAGCEDKYGCWEPSNKKEAYEFVQKLISVAFYGE